MKGNSPIGRVVATENRPTTTGEVRFWLEEGVRLKPFDLVRLSPSDANVGDFYAIINEIEQVSDVPSPLSSFISADFGKAEIAPRMTRVTTTYADATVLFNTEDNEMPVPHESEVHWPDEAGVRRALGMEDYGRPIPAGYITMSGPGGKAMTIPVDMDADYLIGPEGGHLNISGISGLATKTSYAIFLLTAIQQIQESKWSKADGAAFVILNVKGADLLSLHEENPNLDDKTRQDWEKCRGLNAGPLNNVTYFYPYSDAEAMAQTQLDAKAVEQNVASRHAYRYFYNLPDAIERLHLLVEDIHDPQHTLVSCAEHCKEQFTKDTPWSTFRETIGDWARTAPTKQIPVVSWRRFARYIRQRTKNSLFTQASPRADKIAQVSLREMLNHLQPGQVVVVDIANLPDYVQSFVGIYLAG